MKQEFNNGATNKLQHAQDVCRLTQAFPIAFGVHFAAPKCITTKRRLFPKCTAVCVEPRPLETTSQPISSRNFARGDNVAARLDFGNALKKRPRRVRKQVGKRQN
ncbi:unnamed protein product [Ixodes persulcatus]